MARSIQDVVEEAVARGVITAGQASALRDIADETRDTGSPEVARGFNWVTVAYGIGALLVVFACAWFLVERWRTIGAGGVLTVVAAYALVAAVAARWLDRNDFPEAAGIAALIAVSLTPVAVWSIESMSGWWPPETWGRPYYPEYRAAEASRLLVAELATVLAGLLVLRTRRYTAVMFAIGAALLGVVIHGRIATGVAFAPVMDRWSLLTGALLLCATADAVDRRSDRTANDLAFPLWTAGLVAVSAAGLSFWPTAGALHHLVPLWAALAIALALAMHRRTHLVFGILWLFLYLFWLAADVFRSTSYFPLVLAALGGLLLAVTVLMQRYFPALSQRLGAGERRRGGLPGAAWIPWAIAGLALGITALKVPDGVEEVVNREFRMRLEVLRQHSGSIRQLRPPRPAERARGSV